MIQKKKFVTAEKRSDTVFITFDRPEAANAYNEAFLEQFEEALDFCYSEYGNLKALAVKSSCARFFCAGADKKEIAVRRAEDSFILRSRAAFDRLAAWPGISFALVAGAARGGGAELALACDIRICAPEASFGFPEVGLGLLPAAGGCRRLFAAVNGSIARDMILTGRVISGTEAAAFGLANYLAACSQMEKTALDIISKISENSRLAVRMAKEVCRIHGESVSAQAYEACAQALLYEKNFFYKNAEIH